VFAEAADGTRLHYIVLGKGVPVVLVGGKTSSIDAAWWRYLPWLAERFFVIAFDNRGAGESDKPDVPYSTTMMADDALAVLAAAGAASAHWFGLSLGGMVLQALVLHHPEAVRSLVLGCTQCRAGGPGPALTADEERLIAGSPFRRLATLYAPQFIHEHAEWVAEDARHFGKMPLRAIHRQDQAVRGHDTCGQLPEIRRPVLVIHGSADRVVPVAEGEALHRSIPGSSLKILEGAGHQVHSERFAEVAPLVMKFFEQADATP
jgi:pimeloyl-ACP methyl ester carboxylesterase